MPIDLSTEPLLTFPQAAQLLPADRRPSFVTFYRWWRKGVGPQRTKLETVRVGGRRYTSEAAMRRFIDALSSSPNESKANSLKSREHRRSPRKGARRVGSLVQRKHLMHFVVGMRCAFSVPSLGGFTNDTQK